MRALWLPTQFPQCLNAPKHMTRVASWHEHIPFAFFITALHRPSLFVELGVHAGDSYLAFCEGLVQAECASYGPPGDDRPIDSFRAVGIDTFTGDEHSGTYLPEVLLKLQGVHDPEYGAFSHLLVSKFEDAVGSFRDASIDLLHIDGLHTYEAVKRDFEMWLPKLSDRAIVLFHDTAITDNPTFGVWRFWSEIRRGTWPSFSFSHGNGLGVLGVGKDQGDVIRELWRSDGNNDGEWLRGYFKALGRRISLSEPEFFGY